MGNRPCSSEKSSVRPEPSGRTVHNAPAGAGVADEVRVDYLACYERDRFVESMRYVRRYPEELPELAELLPQITTPVTCINGRHDRVVPVGNAEFLHGRLPDSRLRIIDAGHFVWEEAPAQDAAIILSAIARNSA
jgi:pimeloyl-ACP methyl ester carboxylesterase